MKKKGKRKEEKKPIFFFYSYNWFANFTHLKFTDWNKQFKDILSIIRPHFQIINNLEQIELSFPFLYYMLLIGIEKVNLKGNLIYGLRYHLYIIPYFLLLSLFGKKLILFLHKFKQRPFPWFYKLYQNIFKNKIKNSFFFFFFLLLYYYFKKKFLKVFAYEKYLIKKKF